MSTGTANTATQVRRHDPDAVSRQIQNMKSALDCIACFVSQGLKQGYACRQAGPADGAGRREQRGKLRKQKASKTKGIIMTPIGDGTGPFGQGAGTGRRPCGGGRRRGWRGGRGQGGSRGRGRGLGQPMRQGVKAVENANPAGAQTQETSNP